MTLAEQVAGDLGVPVDKVVSVSESASHMYKTYRIRKRGGGQRVIHHPAKPLKAIQRWLVRNLISKLPVHPAAMAYRKGINIKDNAQAHVASRYLMRMDLTSFFPSIRATDVVNYMRESDYFRSFNRGDARFFLFIVCRHGRLTIGAPSSPPLSNALCYKLDVALSGAAVAKSLTYTRYADDMFFSGMAPDMLGDFEDVVRSEVEGLECPANLRVNAEKTRHSSKRCRRQVTGLVLGSDGAVYVSRKVKRVIRSRVYQLQDLSPRERSWLAGMLAFCHSVEPDFLNRLILKYGSERIEQAMSPPLESIPSLRL